ncbi:dihydroxy-acid and 6-phosphogluconate dehydratases signature 1 [Lucifera butyrica]|uniref:Dihydroxy-acid and 6-phosphogluconate dehydratases signature 1 n=1 Tax=Lucifera butyrica TaxID=1351585 RepID=A0A498R1I2_9FIRM|nr:dihydroxy-acid dehydratase [Lucifera butyrica]VBB05069.1 dihydroxy-acid and 6-phosphogluconate dehydratases signature 1 [Lucifera butyrica]
MTKAIANLPAYQRAIAKGHLGSCGIKYRDLEKPIIAVVNTWNEIVPGHCHLRHLAEEVKRGIRASGGQPLEFNTVAICDGIAQGHGGMRYSLPSRELIADSVEAMIHGHGIFDGMVLLGSCDKIVPALLMAAARINIPSIVVTGGPMVNQIKPWESKAARQQFLRGEIPEEKLFDATVAYYPSAGVCPFLGTANTMCLIAEALGMSLSGTAAIPALDKRKEAMAYQSGVAVMRLLEQGIKPRNIMTLPCFYNAIALVAGIGGSLNSVLHLPAIAHECGLNVTYNDFDRISRETPLIVRVAPNSRDYTVADLAPVGGVPAIMKELLPVMHDGMTVDGKNLYEMIAAAPPADGEIIKPFGAPFAPEGGIAVLTGNLAPDGAIVKSSAVPAELWRFSGPARVFETEEECIKAVEDGQVQEGDVIIIRNEGPKGGPGMREMHRTTEVVARFNRVAVITDGRFSGASAGLSVGYLSPEAADNGPIAFVEPGDLIEIDIQQRLLNWHISEEALKQRRDNAGKRSGPDVKSDFLTLYGRNTTSAANGAVRKLNG